MKLDYTPAVLEALARLEEECFGKEVCDRLVEWIITLYDRDNCAFYFKTSGKETMGFLPELESTCKTLGILKQLGLVDTANLSASFTPDMIERLGRFAAQHQSEEDGAWYELPWGVHVGDSKRLYETSSAQQLLKMCGRAPLYPTYSERLAKSGAKTVKLAGNADPLEENKYRSAEDFRAWFEKFLPWHSSYFAGSRMLSNLGDIEKTGFLPLALELLCERIHPETGFLNSDDGLPHRDYDHMSGTYKISGCFAESANYGCRTPMPYFEKLMESTEEVILTDDPGISGCQIANPWALLRNAINTQIDPDPAVIEKYIAVLPALLDRTKEKILSLMSPDGIYSFYPGYGLAANQGMMTDTALHLGEINGVAMIMATRAHLYTALGLPLPTLKTSYTTEEFIRRLNEQPPVQKIVPAPQCRYDFADMQEGVPAQKQGMRHSGDIRVAADPLTGKNAMRIRSSGNRPLLIMDAGTTKGKGFACEFTVRFESDLPAAQLFQVRFGSWAAATVLSFKKDAAGGTLSCYADTLQPAATGLDWNQYHRVKVTYIPDGSKGKVTLWLDGKNLGEYSHCTNGYPLQDAAQDSPCVQFYCDHHNVMTAYLADFSFEELC